jgi:lysophospholipase L1-like esterase
VLCAQQQPQALLAPPAVLKLSARVVELMESTSVAVPGLVRAAAPVLENTRQANANLRRSAANSSFVYEFLTNTRAYLALADSVPKPYPFADEARRQFTELRESAERLETHFAALLVQKEQQLRPPDRDNLRRYSDANAKLPPAEAGKSRVVFFGDSITDGWRLNEYFPEKDFVNRGISGQITSEMLGRMKADVINLKPEAVLILAGTNDLARRVQLETIQNNYVMISDLADKNKIKMIWASVLPVSDHHKGTNPSFERTPERPPSQILELNSFLKRLCSDRGYTYLDYFTALVDETGQLKADLAADGLHPNAAGYRIMAPLALEAIEKTLAPPQQKQKKRRLFGIGN